MKYFYSVLLVMLVGCGAPTKDIPNDQIIAEVQKCNSAGMHGRLLYNGITGVVIGVRCVPKE